MRSAHHLRGWGLGALAVALIGVVAGSGPVGADDDRDDWRGEWNAVITLTNDPNGNELAVFALDAKGRMGKPVFVPTGGDGSASVAIPLPPPQLPKPRSGSVSMVPISTSNQLPT